MTASGAVPTAASSFYRRAPLRIQRLSPHATLPRRGSDLSAGLDLSSAANLTIAAGDRALVPTDLAVACPPGTYGRVAPRSGLALKKGIDVGAGVIDADYRGPLGVILFNWGREDFEIRQGDRVAQLILESIVLPDVVEVQGELDATERGVGGFGSTGVARAPPEEPPRAPLVDAEADASKKPRTISPKNTDESGASSNPTES
jgi:deoxyuridine 5'-triphosphate nucleotidohydrolase